MSRRPNGIQPTEEVARNTNEEPEVRKGVVSTEPVRDSMRVRALTGIPEKWLAIGRQNVRERKDTRRNCEKSTCGKSRALNEFQV